MRKKESMEQQAKVLLARSATMKQVRRPKQVASSSAWRRSKIRLINFDLEECSLARKLCQRTWGHMLTTKIGSRLDQPVWPVWPSGLTDLGAVASLARPTCLTSGSDRSDRSKQSLSTTRDFYRFKSCNRISCGINPPTL
jgi:hypothetical protein